MVKGVLFGENEIGPVCPGVPYLRGGAAAMPPPYPTNCGECLIETGFASQVGVKSSCIRWWSGVS